MSIIGIDITATSTTPEFGLGQLGSVTEGDSKVYKYVQYDTGAGSVAAVSGNVAYYYLAGGTTTYKVTSDVSDSVKVGAGVLQSAPADGEYCWVQVSGSATLTTALTAGADGNALTPVGATDGTLDVSALVSDHTCAIADDISAKQVTCCFPL